MPGKARSYNQRLGHYYNYGCGTAGNTDALFDEVKAADDAILDGSNPWYFRFCCCRKI